MSASEGTATTWQVGDYTATLTMPPARRGYVLNPVIEWSPSVPQKLTADEWKQYQVGRDAAFLALGLRAVIVEP